MHNIENEETQTYNICQNEKSSDQRYNTHEQIIANKKICSKSLLYQDGNWKMLYGSSCMSCCDNIGYDVQISHNINNINDKKKIEKSK